MRRRYKLLLALIVIVTVPYYWLLLDNRPGDDPGPVIRIEFTKGPNPQMVEPPAQEGFTGVSLSYEP